VRYIASGDQASDEFFNRFDTADKLFEVIRDAYDRKADTISVAYDASSGIPISVTIDYLKNAVDEELAFTVGKFELLPD